jgi:hypothetical protein
MDHRVPDAVLPVVGVTCSAGGFTVRVAVLVWVPRPVFVFVNVIVVELEKVIVNRHQLLHRRRAAPLSHCYSLNHYLAVIRMARRNNHFRRTLSRTHRGR